MMPKSFSTQDLGIIDFFFSLFIFSGLRSLFLPLLNNFLQFIFHRQFARLHTGNICRSGHNMSCNRCCAEQKDNTEKEFDIEVPFNEPKIKEDTCECAEYAKCCTLRCSV